MGKRLKLPATALLSALLTFTFLFYHCKDGQDLFDREEVAKISFVGQVLDENGNPIAGAVVTAGATQEKTDGNGVFHLSEVSLPAENAVLKVSKSGYFDFVRGYIVENNSQKAVAVTLLERSVAGTFLNANGGTVVLAGGASLHFPINSIVQANGAAYSSEVVVYARHLQPDNPKLWDLMPGDLRAIDATGNQQFLITYGMTAVELATPTGQKLQLAAGQQAEIRMTVANSQISAAPASIPLWYFDEAKSRWIEEGTAQRVGNEYIGKVSHFTWWNCDYPGPLTTLRGQLFLNDNQTPFANAYVRICSASGCTHGTTDANGVFGGGIPQGVPLTISVSSHLLCSSLIPLYTDNIGPFNGPSDLPPIVIPFNLGNSGFAITGRIVDCNQQPVANGYLRITGGLQYILHTDNQGKFSVVTDNSCISLPLNIEFTGYNLNDLTASIPQSATISLGANDLGDIISCANLGEYFQFDIDGVNYTLPGQGFFAGTEGSIFGISSTGQTPYIGFNHNNQPGTFPILYASFPIPNQQDSTSGVFTGNTVVTQFGQPGQPVEGSFNGTYQPNNSSTTHVINGTYRVKR